jgi:hypothetical protein
LAVFCFYPTAQCSLEIPQHPSHPLAFSSLRLQCPSTLSSPLSRPAHRVFSTKSTTASFSRLGNGRIVPSEVKSQSNWLLLFFSSLNFTPNQWLQMGSTYWVGPSGLGDAYLARSSNLNIFKQCDRCFQR